MHIKSYKVREFIAASIIAIVVFLPSGISLVAQAPRAESAQASGGFPDLIGALKATPGCLGVDAATTASGKQVIFAWFENKRAVLNWYNSETHQKAMQMFSARTGRPPLSEIADGTGPIMVIASLTLADKPQSGMTSLPVSQIAIELYAPLPGGLAVGGRFAPGSVKVPGLLEASAGAGQSNKAVSSSTSTVTVEVVGARNAKGRLGVALFRSPEGFPEDASKAVRQELVDVDSNTLKAQVVFREVPAGTYAVSVRHDENMNDDLDKNFLGMPTEGYGTSNNVKGVFQAPTFDKAKFEVKAAPRTVEIKLIY